MRANGSQKRKQYTILNPKSGHNSELGATYYSKSSHPYHELRGKLHNQYMVDSPYNTKLEGV